MIYGIGVDVVHARRIETILRRHKQRFVARLLHPREYAGLKAARKPATFLAKCFAIKEAFVKALGTGFRGVAHEDIGALRDKLGRPHLVFSASLQRRLKKLKVKRTHVSLSDEGELICAMVVLEQ